ncbi:MAG: DNA repair protein RecO [Clostridia bacterium]|nr:DNA repair protein RecO [Clostridia bacterium]
MEQTKVKAIVIGGIDYKEKDKLITLFTLEQGIISVLFKSVKNSNAKLKASKEPMSFGEYIFTNGNTKTVTSAEIIDSFYDITKNIKKYYTACSIFEIIKTALPIGETSAEFFVSTLKSLELLAYSNADIKVVLIKYLIKAFEIFGYKITFDKCSICGQKLLVHKIFNFSHGDVTCFGCKSLDGIELNDGVYSVMRIISITDFEKLSTLKLKAELVNDVYELLCKNYYYRFGKKLEISI